MRKYQKHAFHFPVALECKLAEHLTSLGTTISERVRLLLMADVDNPAPPIVPKDEIPDGTVTLMFSDEKNGQG